MAAQPVPIVRAAHLLPFLGFLRRVGMPLEGELAKAKLPMSVLEPSQYVSKLAALRFLNAAEARSGVDDFAFRAIEDLALSQLSDELIARIATAPTLFAALRAFTDFARIEDAEIRYWLDGTGDTVRILSHCGPSGESGGLHFAEWLENLVPMVIVRAFAGDQWQPPEMAFRSTVIPGDYVRERFPGTRFLLGQPSAWIRVDRSLLTLRPPASLRRRGEAATQRLLAKGTGELKTEFPEALRKLLAPYLADGYPRIELAADLIGTSVRSLQRHLAATGLTYSEIIEHIRFDTATRLLMEEGAKVIGVAYAVGYEDPSNFARAFRRVAGVSPRRYRDRQHAL